MSPRKCNPISLFWLLLILGIIPGSAGVLPVWTTPVALVCAVAALFVYSWMVTYQITIRITRRKPRRFQLTVDQATVAAKAWTQQLCPPIPVNYFGEGAPRCAILALAEPQRAIVTPEQAEAFQKALLLYLLNGLDVPSIGCDYDPDRALNHALREAKIYGISPLPDKSHTWFGNGGVSASWGYQQASEELLPNKQEA